MAELLADLVVAGYKIIKRAVDGDVGAREQLVDIIGQESRLETERKLDEAAIASLPEG
jgi:hypothetical protein